jgi:hypothetical protein
VRRQRAVVCHDALVPEVIVVLFWIWVLVALGVYSYRLFRRATQGPKAKRQASDVEGETGAAGGVLGRLGKSSPPPLPEGPIEARLPQSLQNQPPPAPDDDSAAMPEGGGADVAPAGARADASATGPGSPGAAEPTAVPRPTTLAEALHGIRMPADLLPVVQAGEPGLIDGRRARFGATGTNIPTVAEALGDELRRLGFAVDGLDTIGSARAGLTATRGDTAVSASISIDDDSGAVIVELNV